MNSVDDSIEILISDVYQRDISPDPAGIRYEVLMKGPLGLLKGIKGTKEKSIEMKILSEMAKNFGSDVIQHDRKGHPILKIQCKYLMDEAKDIVKAASNDFTHLEELAHFLSGSRVVFKRRAYWHTGVLLTKTNGEMMIIHLERDRNVFKLKIRSAGDVLGVEPSPMVVDNLFLVSRGVDMNKLFYRYSRLAERRVAYNATQLNCDVLAKFLMTGLTNWTTTKEFHMPVESIPGTRRQITRLTLEELNEENYLLKRTELPVDQ